jgi:hypothetical protein
VTLLDRLLCRLEPTPVQEEPLKCEDFPALFRAADAFSFAQQKAFFVVLALELFLMILATAISVLNVPWSSMAIVQAIALFGALAAAIYLFTAKPDRHWYSARAVAESAKTLTWRYVTRAEPFDTDDLPARNHFGRILNDIVEQNCDVTRRFCTDLDGTQITDAMSALRQSSFDERKTAYVAGRVVEQQSWYARKNKVNDCLAKRSFLVLAGCLVVAGILAICRVRFFDAPIWPTDVFVGLATTILAWTQAKRFSELAASYSLAAYEISVVRLQSESIHDPEALSKFVGDAENAFSREHTQWVARKDV